MSGTPGKFKKGDRACMMVLSILENVKSFNTVNGFRYRHDITFLNDKKDLFVGEYLTPHETQREFQQGKKACFEAIDHGVIMPVGSADDWDKIGDKILLPRNIEGSSYVFALQSATSIHAAIIASGKDTTTEDMLTTADTIQEWIVKQQKESLNIVG